MPSDPIRELILQDCAAALWLIDGTGAYYSTLADVQRGKAVPNMEDPLPVAFLDEGDEDQPEEDTNLLLKWSLPIAVKGWLRSADESLHTLANRLLADIERAICADPTRGGLAKRITITSRGITTDEAPGTLASVQVQFLVQYYTLRGNPASKG
jgi:hypothetical protein